MKMKKVLFSLALPALALSLCLTGCGGISGTSGSGDGSLGTLKVKYMITSGVPSDCKITSTVNASGVDVQLTSDLQGIRSSTQVMQLPAGSYAMATTATGDCAVSNQNSSVSITSGQTQTVTVHLTATTDKKALKASVKRHLPTSEVVSLNR